MTYQILSRRYRPQRFDELFGQEHVVRQLGAAVATGRVGQAYLFVGPRGVGKTTTARILARALNCEARVPVAGEGLDSDLAGAAAAPTKAAAVPQDLALPEPCGVCDACRDIAKGVDLDVVEMDAASNNHVEDVRALREQVGYAAVRSRYRIWIVDEVHMLSTAAFNAFLKTLEEPPPRVKFFFCTTELHKLPDTIVSRCTKIELRPVRRDAIVARLAWLAEQEGLVLEEGLPEAIAVTARGGLRDAESMLEQLVAASPDGVLRSADLDLLCGRASDAHVVALFDAIAAEDPGAALDAVDASLGAGAKPSVVLDQWLDRLRADLVRSARAEAGAVAPSAHAIDLLLAKRAHLRAGADGGLVLQVAAVELARLPRARDLDALLAALEGGARPRERGDAARRESATDAAGDEPRPSPSRIPASSPAPSSAAAPSFAPSAPRKGSSTGHGTGTGTGTGAKASTPSPQAPSARPSPPSFEPRPNAPRPPAAGAKPKPAPKAGSAARPGSASATRPTPRPTSSPTSSPSIDRKPAPAARRSVAPVRRLPPPEVLDVAAIRERWAGLVADVSAHEPRLAAVLHRSEVVAMRGLTLHLRVEDGSHEARTALIQAGAQAAFGHACRQRLGQALKPVVATAGPSAAQMATSVDEGLRDHPVVARITDACDGRLVHVERRAMQRSEPRQGDVAGAAATPEASAAKQMARPGSGRTSAQATPSS